MWGPSGTLLKEEDIRVLGVGAIWNFVKEQDIRVLGVGAIWNFFLKEQGSYNVVQNMGHKGPVLRPRYIGPGRA